MQTSGNGQKPLSDINVTPFVDVMLVLLVIFMITAPLIQHGIKVSLPQAKTAPIETKEKELMVSIDKNKNIYLMDKKYSFVEFENKMPHIFKAKKNKRIFLSADKSLPYEMVIKVMATIKNAGFDEVGLVTEPELFLSKKEDG